MKKFIVLIVVLALAVIFIPWLQPKGSAMEQHQATFLVNQKMYISDGQTITMDVAPFTRDGRVYVPVRYLGRALGVPDEGIAWDGASQTVAFTTDAAVIRMTVGSQLLYVGEEERSMDVAPLAVSDRVFIPARWLAEALQYEVEWDETAQAILIGPPGDLPAPPSKANDLPVVGTYENLKSLLANLQTEAGYDQRVMKNAPAVTGAAPESAKSADTAQSLANASGSDYSRTNVQVEGVDEADIVKTDGSYIYLVKDQRVVIAKAYPAGDMQMTGSLDFTDKNFIPNEMYVDDRHLIVIGQTYSRGDGPIIMPMDETSKKISPDIYPPPYQRDTVKAIIYDIADKSAIKQVRELELDGRYVSSRKIGEAFYLLANRGIYYYPQKEIENPKPFYRDTATGNDYVDIDYTSIKCFPDFMQPNYLIVAGINLDRPDEKADVNTYLGSSENIYASMKNLYVAVTSASYRYGILEDSAAKILPGSQPADRNKTKVYKFALNDGKLSYSAGGEVPGTILNQFSMDEYNDNFRIATTSGDVWRTGEYTSKNNVYVLDSGLNVVGQLEDIAPGEKIYSVRFVGDRGYMVTFKTVDPFFVIDLGDPGQPEILGALKIPGYSDYLHPYDENHIIGFGKDTIELGQKGDNSGGTNSVAYYTGMKMAVFDVTDVSNPVEMYKEKIGDRGTDSELLRNHKALLFSKDKNLLAFPVSLMEVNGGEVRDGFPAYGQFVYQGAYVYNIDLDNGFALKGRITHLSDEDYKKAGSYWYDSDKNVDRIIYINDVLYTLSGRYIKANSLSDLAEIGTLEIK
ncbi:beta-propeller domain-containing protein [Pelotomaculum terephthalicicum JT]|uniref:beta-propeller domain-containing protein n=1 Tax=Pelotomaculum TaxID=191373 RepID=UPI0009C54A40|nr:MULTISPECIES: beta-propeller domain-containing protein [Pelotomaculum]MCG9967336.1 beta-propeller domain-containing protein [Pelotomaculum terephthalicicum JT]OPX90687.1 MAG: Beta propeller domain protein [Pelotomaculum sp. PtaB.Bin117]OPY61311.1 MAG: Beta propeller domain protein [Pelotomaculum sp. PtaU1.Bin065]